MTAPGWYQAQGDPPGTNRYWDGAQWVGDPVPAPGSPQAFAAPGVPGAPVGLVQRDGKLTASGILSLISAGVVGLVGLWILIIANSDEFDFIDDLSGGAFTLVGLFVLFVAALYLTGGIGSVQGRSWGRILTIVLQSIVGLLFVLGLIGATAEGDTDAVGAFVPLIWTATILGLAIAGKPWR